MAGPWASRGGYEPIGQTASGLAIDEGSADEPMLAPTFTLNDYVTAYLAAAGTLGRAGAPGARRRQLPRQGVADADLDVGAGARPPAAGAVARPLARPPAAAGAAPVRHDAHASVFGEIEHPAPITRFSETKAFWDRPPQPPGASRPEWLPRG